VDAAGPGQRHHAVAAHGRRRPPVGEGGQLWATRDGGLSWQAQASGTSRNLRVVAAHDGQTAWAAGAQGTLLATATGGR